MELQDISWKQRFQNFEKALNKFNEAALQPNLDELERNGLIQRFEFTLELVWKVIKDYTEFKGFPFITVSPKAFVNEAFANNIVKDVDGMDKAS